jgi:hypothetical protein
MFSDPKAVVADIDAMNWITETAVLLTSSPYQWIDQASSGQKKFYRTFLLP